MVLIVDIANVMGARPDGWWRDRAGAATRLLGSLAGLPLAPVEAPDGGAVTLTRVVGVLEGKARSAAAPATDVAGPILEVVLAAADGDTTIVEVAAAVRWGGERPLVVTADRGLRARLPAGSIVTGPRWLLGLL